MGAEAETTAREVASDEELQTVFRTADEQAGDEPDADEGTTEESEEGDEGRKAEDTDTDLQAIRDELLQLRTENNILRTMQPAPVREPVQQPATVAKESDGIDEAAFTAQLQTNPAKAITDVVQNTVKSALREFAKEFSQQTSQQMTQQQRLQQQREQDNARTVAEYGQYLTDPQFRSLAAQEYGEIVGEEEWRPGALYRAASTAFAQLVKQGKLALPGQGKVVDIRARERAPKPANMMLGQGTEAEGRPPGPEADFSAHEMRIIDRVCRDFGISRKQYFEQYGRLRGTDPFYGGQK